MSEPVRRRHAFTLPEVVVALLLAASAALAFSATALAELKLRRLVESEWEGARVAREHLDLLAARRCGQDTGGRRAARWGESWWSARAIGNGRWRWHDSTRALGSLRASGTTSMVACAP